MKKTSKLVALLLVLAMVLSLTACGNPAKNLYGTWSSEFDLSEALAQEMGDEFADFDAPFAFTIYFDFNEDGTCKMYVDQDEFSADMTTWIDELVAYAVDMMYDTFEQQGVDKDTADSLLQEQFGMSIDEYMKSMIAESIDLESMAADFETTGVYEVKGNKLYIAEDEIDKNSYDIFSIEGDVLTIDMAEGAEASDVFSDIEGINYPFTFTRVQAAE